jgi:hypothetical protein
LFKNTIYKLEEDNDLISLLSSKNKYTIVKDTESDNFVCNCYDYSTYLLPCSHIFYVRKHKSLPIFEPEMISWKNGFLLDKNTIEPSNNVTFNSNRRKIHIPSMNRFVVPESNFLTTTESKFIEVRRIMNNLTQIIIKDSDSHMNDRMQIILQINDLFERKIAFKIQPLDENGIIQQLNVNQQDLSSYQTTIDGSIKNSTMSSSSSNQSSSSQFSQQPTCSKQDEAQSGCFVKINFGNKDLVKSAPKRGAPTKD